MKTIVQRTRFRSCRIFLFLFLLGIGYGNQASGKNSGRVKKLPHLSEFSSTGGLGIKDENSVYCRKTNDAGIVAVADNEKTLTTLPNPPLITSISSTSGPIGSLVKISGKKLNKASAVKIGNKDALLISNDGKTLVAMVMPGTVSGKVSIVTSGGRADSTDNFNVIASGLPNAQQGDKLVASSVTGLSNQGNAVAVSADGTTAIVGGVFENNTGAAWIYTRNNNQWEQQAKLEGNLAGNLKFGMSVSISADGNTAVVGAPGYGELAGAVFVFTRNGINWSQQGRLTINSADTHMGISISLSADGNTFITGSPGYNEQKGSAFIFTRKDGTWTKKKELKGSTIIKGSLFGESVAISADGTTAIVGAKEHLNGMGAVWIFKKTAADWSEEHYIVNPGASTESDYNPLNTYFGFGKSVTLSADGSVALIGQPGYDSGKGAAWTYTRGNSWTTASRLVTDNSGRFKFGQSVALSADGVYAFVGEVGSDNGDYQAPGAYWIFMHSYDDFIRPHWTQYGKKILGSDPSRNSWFGQSIAISADATTLFVGSPGENNGMGAARAFAYKDLSPKINSFDPKQSPVGGLVEIRGENLKEIQSVSIGDISAIPVSNDGNTLKIMVMPETVKGHIMIATNNDTLISVDAFEVIPSIVPNIQIGDDLNIPGAEEMAISTDGSTFVVGVPSEGAVLTYKRTTSGWVQNGNKLVGHPFGNSLDISADGNRMVVGSKDDAEAWVYNYNTVTSDWNEATKLGIPKIPVYQPGGLQTCISADGSIIVLGDKNSNLRGSVSIFKWDEITKGWINNIIPRPDGAGDFGQDVAISEDGKTIIASGTRTEAGVRKKHRDVYVYNYNRDSNSTTLITSFEKQYESKFGDYISISANGKRILVSDAEGNADLFTNTGEGWLSKSLRFSGGLSSMALSADGNIAVMGKSVIVFQTGTENILKQYELLGGSSNNEFVAISQDGNTVLVNETGKVIHIFNGNISKPSVYFSSKSLDPFSTTVGTPSAVQSITIFGLDLIDGLTITAPDGIELSLNDTFSDGGKKSIVLPHENGMLMDDIYVRISDSAPVGAINGVITLYSYEAISKETAVSGMVFRILSGNYDDNSNLTTTYGSASTPDSIFITGSNLASNIAVSLSNTNYELSVNRNNWTPTLELVTNNGDYSGTIYIRLKATAQVGSSDVNLTLVSGDKSSVSPITNNRVSKAPLTITANSVTKTYGDVLYDGSTTAFSVGRGLVNGETITSVAVSYGSGKNRDAGVGTYPNEVTIIRAVGTNGFNASNYSISYFQGNITVEKALLTVDISTIYKKGSESWSGTRTVTGSDGAIVTGFKNGETFNELQVSISGDAPVSQTAYTRDLTLTDGINSIKASSYIYDNYRVDGVVGKLISHPDYCYDNRWNTGTVRMEAIPNRGGVRVAVNIRTRGGRLPDGNYIRIRNLSRGTRANFRIDNGQWSATTPLPNGYTNCYATVSPNPEYGDINIVPNFNDLYELGTLSLPGCFPASYEQKIMVDPSSLKKDSVETITDMDSNQLVVYPNPVSSIVNIDYLPKAEGNVVFNVVSMSGTELVSQSIAGKNGERVTCTFNLKEKGLASGTYIVRVTAATETLTRKVIVE